jgi:hypothetical protein
LSFAFLTRYFFFMLLSFPLFFLLAGGWGRPPAWSWRRELVAVDTFAALALTAALLLVLQVVTALRTQKSATETRTLFTDL